MQFPEFMSLVTFKLAIQCGLTLLSLVSWILPLNSKRFTQNEYLLGILNSFSGGVFLTLGFMHLIPHSIGVLSDHFPDQAHLTFVCVLIGYFLIFFLDKIAFRAEENEEIQEKGIEHENGDKNGRKLSNDSERKKNSKSSTWILLLALSIHCLFENIALGLARSRKDVLLLSVSIGLHLPAEAVALLISLLKASSASTIPQMLLYT